MSRRKFDEDYAWISISDLMLGMMMIFLLTTVVYMRKWQNRDQDINNKVVTYYNEQRVVYGELRKEFEADLAKWNATLDSGPVKFVFRDDRMFFKPNESNLTSEYENILNDFVPRLVACISRHKDKIREIKIKGYASSEYSMNGQKLDARAAYMENMALSQARSRMVLDYILRMTDLNVRGEESWIRKHITANGLSSSDPILRRDGTEDVAASRRVEFELMFKSEDVLQAIDHLYGSN